MKKIGVVTSSRADYGIYLPILREIQESPALELLLFVTGTHLSAAHGRTLAMIEQDGFQAAAEVEVLLSDTPGDTARAMGRTTTGFAQVFEQHCPDMVLVLGDRFEMHAAAVAAIPFRIPLAHIHGGELTFGAIDDCFRHSLTKLSDVHFAATEVYARRIQQMGEPAELVFAVGAPGLDGLDDFSGYTRAELETTYQLDLSRPTLLVTFHPVTTEPGRNSDYMDQLLQALDRNLQCHIVFTRPNADPENQGLVRALNSFLQGHDHAVLVENFGQKGYFSMMKEAAVMVGNSSSGIIEAASFGLPVVNIGTRQDGRVRAANVIDVGYSVEEIEAGLARALTPEFRQSLAGLVNPYGAGGAAGRIVRVLEDVDLEQLGRKSFCDIPGGVQYVG